MKHLILVGACYLDTILSVPQFPEEDSKLRATELKIRRGGNCPNSLEVLQQFISDGDNVQMHLVSCLPEESAPATKRILSSFGPTSKIDFGKCIYRRGHAEAASSYIIRSQESDSRTIVNYNGLPEMTVQEFGAIVDGFSDGDETWWHFEGRIPHTILSCIRLLRQRLPRSNVSVEVEKPGREGLPELAAEADVVFYSRTWAESRGHLFASDCLAKEQRRQRSVGLCTWGADGATVMSQPSGEITHCPVQSETKGGISVVDPVGAGDTFIAGMLYGLIRSDEWQHDISTKAAFAVRLATLKVQREGFDGLRVDVLGAKCLAVEK